MKILIALLFGLTSAASNAAILTYNFSGIFDAPGRSAPPGVVSPEPLFKGLIKEGDRFSGAFTFDSNAKANYIEPSPLSYAQYDALGFRLNGTSAFNAALPALPAGHVQVTDNAGYDPEWSFDELIASTEVALDASHALTFVLRMDPANNKAFNDYRVPDGFNRFTGANLYVYMYYEGELIRDWVSATVQVGLDGATAVPEPATGLLLLGGLAGLALRRSRR